MKRSRRVDPYHPLIRFYEHVKKTPEKPLTIDHFSEGNQKIWTYQAMDKASSQLAGEIKKTISAMSGVAIKSARIAVAVEVESFYHVALLAIWKLGMVYVPLMTRPENSIVGRIKVMEINLLLVDQSVYQSLNLPKTVAAGRLIKFVGTPCINIHTLFQQRIIDLNGPHKVFVSHQKDLSQDAYINSSSGTSGTPKVIINSLLGLSGRVEGLSERMNITDKSAFLGYVAPPFDAHLLDFLMTFSNGATIYLINYSIRNDYLGQIADLFIAADTLYRYQQAKLSITHAVLLPTVLDTLSKTCNLEIFSTLEALLTMGEKCQLKTLEPWFKIENKKKENLPPTVWNGYGPTEMTIAATLTKMLPSMQEYDMASALPGVHLYLMVSKNKDREIVPINFSGEKDSKAIKAAFFKYKNPAYLEGELYIGGLGAGHYLDKELDKQKYIQMDSKIKQWCFYEKDESNQQSDKKSKPVKIEKIVFEAKTFIYDEKMTRIYRTGDIVRLSIDGNLLFQERIDGCVKVNGKIVILAEIEKLIQNLKLAPVRRVQVGIEAGQIIACLLVTNAALDSESKKLTNEISKSLLTACMKQPSHLRPKFIFCAREFKYRDNSGKFDLSATLKQKDTHFVYRVDDRLCSSNIETEIAKIWQEILFGDNEKIKVLFPSGIKFTINAHFEEWGGNSLTTIQMISRVWGTLIPRDHNTAIQAPISFVEWVLTLPTILRIAQYVSCYLSLNIQVCGSQMPPVFLVQFDDQSKTLPEVIKAWPAGKQKLIGFNVKINELEDKEQKALIDNVMISKAVAARIREFQRSGPYHLLLGQLNLQSILANENHVTMGLKIKEILESQNEKVLLSIGKELVTDNKSPHYSFIHITNLLELQVYIETCAQTQLRMALTEKLQKWYEQHKPKNFKNYEKAALILSSWPKTINYLWLEGPMAASSTELLHNIYQIAWKQYLINIEKNPVPIFIDLQGQFDMHNLDQLLAIVGITMVEKQLLLQNGLLILCDHFELLPRFDYLNFFIEERDRKEQYNPNKNIKVMITTTYCHLKQALKLSGWSRKTYKILELKLEKGSASSPELITDPLNWLNKFHQFVIQAHPHWRKSQISHQGFLNYVINLIIAQVGNQFLIDHQQQSQFLQGKILPHHFGNPYFKMLSLLFIKKITTGKSCYGVLPDVLFELFQQLKPASATIDEKENIVSRMISKSCEEQKYYNIPKKNLQKLYEMKNGSVATVQPGDHQYPIFAFYPLTGDSPNQYRELLQSLGPNQSYCLFQMNPNNSLVESDMTITAKAEHFVDLIQNYSNGPCILLGWSFGGLLAFKVAECLQREKRTIIQLIIIDCPPPNYLNSISEAERSLALIKKLAEEIYGINEISFFQDRLQQAYQKIKQEYKEEKISEPSQPSIADKIFEITLSELKGTDLTLQQQQNNEITALLLPLLTVNQSLDLMTKESYKALYPALEINDIIHIIFQYLDSRYRESFIQAMSNCKINLRAYYEFGRMSHQPLLSPLVVAEAKTKTYGLNQGADYLAWGALTSTDFDRQIFDGDHFTIFSNEKFVKYIRELVCQVQPVILPIDLEERIIQYQINQHKNKEQQLIVYIPHYARSFIPVTEEKKGERSSKSSFKTKPINDFIEPFLNTESLKDSSACLIIAGEAGIGKTTIIKNIANNNKFMKKWIMVYVESTTDILSAITQAIYKNLNVTDSEINSPTLLQKHFLFLFDNYDAHLPSKQELQFFKTRWSESKIIFACHDYRINYKQHHLASATIIFLNQFNDEQIETYLKLNNAKDFLQDHKLYSNTLHQLGLKTLIRNPLILSLINTMLPFLIKNEIAGPWSLTKIYFEIFYFHRKKIIKAIKEKEGLFPGFNLNVDVNHFAAKLAFEMLNYDIYEDNYFFCGNDLYVAQLRQACECFLTYDQNKIIFIHQTYHDFWIAYYLFLTFNSETTNVWISENKLNSKFHLVFRFLAGLIGLLQPNFNYSLLSKLLEEPNDLLGNYLLNLIDTCVQEMQSQDLAEEWLLLVNMKSKTMRQIIGNDKLCMIEKNSLPRFSSEEQFFSDEKKSSVVSERLKITGKDLSNFLSTSTELKLILHLLVKEFRKILIEYRIPNETTNLIVEIGLGFTCEYVIKQMEAIKAQEKEVAMNHLSDLIVRFKGFMLGYLEKNSNLDQFLQTPLESLQNQIDNEILKFAIPFLINLNNKTILDLLINFSQLSKQIQGMLIFARMMFANNPQAQTMISSLSVMLASREGQKKLLSELCQRIVYENDDNIKRSCLSLWADVSASTAAALLYCDMAEFVESCSRFLSPSLQAAIISASLSDKEVKEIKEIKEIKEEKEGKFYEKKNRKHVGISIGLPPSLFNPIQSSSSSCALSSSINPSIVSSDSGVISLAYYFISQGEGVNLGKMISQLNPYQLKPILKSLEQNKNLLFLRDFMIAGLSHEQFLPIEKFMILDFMMDIKLLIQLDAEAQKNIIKSIIYCLNSINKTLDSRKDDYFLMTRLGTSCFEALGNVVNFDLTIINVLLKQLKISADQLTLTSYSVLIRQMLKHHKNNKLRIFCHNGLINEQLPLFLELLAIHGHPAWINNKKLYCSLNNRVLCLVIKPPLLKIVNEYFQKYSKIWFTSESLVSKVPLNSLNNLSSASSIISSRGIISSQVSLWGRSSLASSQSSSLVMASTTESSSSSSSSNSSSSVMKPTPR